MPCYRFLVVLHRRADLGLPRSLQVRSSVRQEAEIIRSVAAVLKVGVLISSIFVLADLYVFGPYSERVVDVGRAFAVRLLTLDELVLRAVGVIRYPVRRCLLRSEQHREPSPVLFTAQSARSDARFSAPFCRLPIHNFSCFGP